MLEAEALQLDPADRSHLLERLIGSPDFDPEVEEAWEREADVREAEFESGLVAPGKSWDQAEKMGSGLKSLVSGLFEVSKLQSQC